MFFKLIGLLIMLGIGIPILWSVYGGMVSVNGTWTNWTVGNTTAYSTFELGLWQLMPIIATLMCIGFILALIAGMFKKEENPYLRR